MAGDVTLRTAATTSHRPVTNRCGDVGVHVAVLGAGGQVGRAVAERLPDAVTFHHADLDIGDADAVDAVDWSRFDTGATLVHLSSEYVFDGRAPDEITLAARGVSSTVVADQIGRPTFADDLAEAIVHLIATDGPYGTYHVTNTGDPASWADVALTTFALAGSSPSAVTDTTTAAYFADRPDAAARPLDSVLSGAKAHAAGVQMPVWAESLAAYVKSEGPA